MQITVGDLRKNLKQALTKLPLEIIDGRRGAVIAVIMEPQNMPVTKPVVQIPGANKAMEKFMAKNTMVESSEVVNKVTGKQCELPICRRDAVGQGTWVEYDMETGERAVTLWLCQEHLEKGKRNVNGY